MVIKPEIDLLLSKVDSKYTLCIVSARRARQINDMLHGVRDQALLTMASSQITELTKTKPLTKALEEIAEGDVSYERVQESYK
ncbi:MAG: DNA-directed RNA polymerase subunit omega [Anaerosomatales bacterium]|jgi:DNA-directed RNA polymerase subunit omega|nr:DNA-directed RNA polymerase subunit omega [Anaerosomatales bacterium]MDT8433284.1 DNA-directed RNA polymerase subunit omega [Anaerosomatales bacterium]